LIQTSGAQLSVLAEKSVLPPFGVCGGGPGATNRFWVRRDGRRVEASPLPGKVSAFPLEPGDVLLMESSGGGGFGDPLERDPARGAATGLGREPYRSARGRRCSRGRARADRAAHARRRGRRRGGSSRRSHGRAHSARLQEDLMGKHVLIAVTLLTLGTVSVLE